METVRRFISNTRWIYVSKLISAGLYLPFIFILGRHLGAYNYGLFALLISVLTFVRIFGGSGLGPSTGKHLANLGVADNHKTGQLLATGLFIQIIVAVVLGIALWFSAGNIAVLIGNQKLASLLKIGAFTFVFYSLTEFFKASVQGVQRFDFLAYITGVEFSGKLFLSAGLALAGFGLSFTLWGYTVALALSSILGIILCMRLGIYRPKFTRTDIYSLIGYSVPLMITTAGFVIYTELDNLMIGFYAGAYQVGLYSVAMSIVRAVPLFANPIGQAAAPLVAKLMRDKKSEAIEFTDRLIKYTIAFFAAIVIFIYIAAPKLLLLVGPGYIGATVFLRVMTVFILSLSVSVVVAPILDYLGEAKKRARWMTISVSGNVALNFLLIPRFGGIGAAVATAVTHIPFVVSSVYVLAIIVGLEKKRLLANIVKISFAGMVSGFIAALSLSFFKNLLFSLTIASALYLSMLFLLKILTYRELYHLRTSVLAEFKPKLSGIEESEPNYEFK